MNACVNAEMHAQIHSFTSHAHAHLQSMCRKCAGCSSKDVICMRNDAEAKPKLFIVPHCAQKHHSAHTLCLADTHSDTHCFPSYLNVQTKTPVDLWLLRGNGNQTNCCCFGSIHIPWYYSKSAALVSPSGPRHTHTHTQR
ncbi:hypothetical protein ILYODFUR_006810 [Ilyodon furcidens]|uniref:Uncharacterized protein n=1 Tax=Ilyodon furcidens TaxID=33524 RepID=A0ABV0T5Y1_9TELE